MRRNACGGSEKPVCLVTGGAGFIGSHLVEALVAQGERVRVLDDFSAGRKENLAGLEDRAEVLEGDVRDPDACRRACEGVGSVFHEAARVSVEQSVTDPVGCHEVNALGTLKMLCAARDAGCKRFVYAGSASAYGDIAEIPQREDMAPQPLSPYAVAKHVGELYCRMFFALHGVETVVLRYFNVFGPRQDSASPYSGVIAKFASSFLKGETVTIFGDGDQSRDFVPVADVVNANLLAHAAPGAAGKLINIGRGERISVNQLAEMLKKLTGSGSPIRHGPPRQGEVRHSQANIGRARDLLAYEPGAPLVEGLRRTVDWYRSAL